MRSYSPNSSDPHCGAREDRHLDPDSLESVDFVADSNHCVLSLGIRFRLFSYGNVGGNGYG